MLYVYVELRKTCQFPTAQNQFLSQGQDQRLVDNLGYPD